MRSMLSLTLGLFLFTVMVSVSEDAHAKRFGGGLSFGSKSSFSQPYKRSTAPSQKQAGQQQSPNAAAATNTAGKRSGMMGMLGGLAMGGLLGALFFGGAFENINFLDILIFGAIAFLLFRLFAARRQRPAMAVGSADGMAQQHTVQRQGSGFDTDLLFNKGGPAAGPAAVSAMPADFDSAGFIEGAKGAFMRLQAAWDAGDLADIRQFTTDKVFAEIQGMLKEREGDNRTDVLKLEAELLEVREVGNELEATVLFDALMRENDVADERAAQVREVWHFTRPVNGRQPTWFLDGIQQLED